jgi:two-component system nitrate/nitrite response regulator NarL
MLREACRRSSALCIRNAAINADQSELHAMPRRFPDAQRHTETPSFVTVIVHASSMFREGLRSILAKSPFEPACAAASLEDVPGTISGTDERVLVLIGALEGSNLAEALSWTKRRFPAAHVVVVGDATKLANVTTALELGATTFVDENTATSCLIKELELVALGEPVISVFILKELLENGSGFACKETASTAAIIDEPQPPDIQEQAEPTVQFSCREAAILSHLVLGTPNKVIAYKLRISEATVKVHVKAILRKIRVKNRTQAAIWAINRQALPLGAATTQPTLDGKLHSPSVAGEPGHHA